VRTYRAAPVGMGSVAPSLWHLSGGYRFRGLEDWTAGCPKYADLPGDEVDAEEDEDVEATDPPSVIVARLHEQIAARSPGHAALVAEYERIAPFLRRPPRGAAGLAAWNSARMAERDAQLRQYAGLRTAGHSKKQARAQLGLSETSATRYEADMQLVAGGDS
jgi:hypothetical protein